MPWIRMISPAEATGLLQRLYKEASKRAGKVYHILRIQSLRPQVLRLSIQLYTALMHRSADGLSRVQREMIATVTSRINQCHY